MFLPETMAGSHELAIVVRLLLAALAGGIIGLEREKHGRPAGLRTHLLVALGACLMMIISESFPLKYGGADATGVLRIDPARTAAQIISGIGFLGAGVILKEGLSVRGLTTAASLWMVAGLGMAFGMGLAVPAAVATVIALASLIFLQKLEPVMKRDRYLYLTVVARQRKGLFAELEGIFAGRNLRITNLRSDLDLEEGRVRFEFVITQQRQPIGRELTEAIAMLEGVQEIKFK